MAGDTACRESALKRSPFFFPMSTFDPRNRCRVRDRQSGTVIPWNPEASEDYLANASVHAVEVVAWNGYLLDGWEPAGSGARRTRSR